MNVVIQVSEQDRKRAWGYLVRHSPGQALPNSTFVISEAAADQLRETGVEFTELYRGELAVIPEAPSLPNDTENVRFEQIQVGLKAYILAILNVLWSAIRHPFKTTEIDLETGRVVRHI